MIVIIYVLSGLQLFFGVLVMFSASGAMHEITAAVAFAGGSISLGIAFLMTMKERQADRDTEFQKLISGMAKKLDSPSARKEP